MKEFTLDIAHWFSNESERLEGLRGRWIAEDQCAVFEYPRRTPKALWNLGVLYPIYASAVDDDMVVACERLEANDPHPVSLPACSFVIESRVPIEAGSVVDLFSPGGVEVGW